MKHIMVDKSTIFFKVHKKCNTALLQDRTENSVSNLSNFPEHYHPSSSYFFLATSVCGHEELIQRQHFFFGTFI